MLSDEGGIYDSRHRTSHHKRRPYSEHAVVGAGMVAASSGWLGGSGRSGQYAALSITRSGPVLGSVAVPVNIWPKFSPITQMARPVAAARTRAGRIVAGSRNPAVMRANAAEI